MGATFLGKHYSPICDRLRGNASRCQRVFDCRLMPHISGNPERPRSAHGAVSFRATFQKQVTCLARQVDGGARICRREQHFKVGTVLACARRLRGLRIVRPRTSCRHHSLMGVANVLFHTADIDLCATEATRRSVGTLRRHLHASIPHGVFPSASCVPLYHDRSERDRLTIFRSWLSSGRSSLERPRPGSSRIS